VRFDDLSASKGAAVEDRRLSCAGLAAMEASWQDRSTCMFVSPFCLPYSQWSDIDVL
jgi:hypothetical protein